MQPLNTFTVPAPLDQNNVLWQMSGALNNLLARLAHLRQENHALREAARGSHTD